MSKIRNRNVRALPPCDLTNFPLPNPNNNSSTYNRNCVTRKKNDEYFGENVQHQQYESLSKIPVMPSDFLDPMKTTPSSSVLSGSDNYLENLIFGANKSNRAISSSSSLSWSDEYESEASRKVQEELERMDRILRGVEPIPPHYDKEEYEEWMELFPKLSILDNSRENTSNTIISKSKRETDVRNLNSPVQKELRFKDQNTRIQDCDINNTSNEITKAVIKKIYENVSNRLLNQRANETHKRPTATLTPYQSKNIFTLSQKSKKLDAHSYLKISPIKRRSRKQSSKSLLEPQLSMVSRDASPEYTSLPFLINGGTKRNSFSTKSQNRGVKLNVNGHKIDHHQLILPPIQNDYRSISATPCNNNSSKSLSAMSMKLSESSNKDNSDIRNFIVDNSLPRRTPGFFQASKKPFIFQ